MIKYENQCCGCATDGYPCIGESCPYVKVPVYYCDNCKEESAHAYEIDGEHYCEECAGKYMKDIFLDLSTAEQAEILNIERLDS